MAEYLRLREGSSKLLMPMTRAYFCPMLFATCGLNVAPVPGFVPCGRLFGVAEPLTVNGLAGGFGVAKPLTVNGLAGGLEVAKPL
ncbi:MAG TPA: hypothetical protein PKC93_12005, partial [Candidatus Obscuribacter sp.]|nr:hypothetical protein [Candidatus Obscuribacter sp.]